MDDEEQNDHTPLWSYVTKIDKVEKGGNVQWQCNLCNKVTKSSYSRVRAHLLRIKGVGISTCSKVTSEIMLEMQRKMKEAEERLKPVQVPFPPGENSNQTLGVLVGRSVKGVESIDSYETTRGGKKRKEYPLEKAFNLEGREQLRSEIARMFYSSGLPFHLARNPYYVHSYTYAANTNLDGFVPPGYNALRTTLLQRERANIEKLLTPIKETWSEKGVSVVSNGWSDSQRRPLINFMAVTESGPMFIKAVNAEGQFKDRFYISNLLKEVIMEIKPQNVVQVITDNAPVCKAAGMIIEAQFSHIFWTPCVVHTLNLALKNICAAKNTESNDIIYGECKWITTISGDVMVVKNFITNHSMRSDMYKRFVTLKLLSVADTRFASTLIMLRRFKLIKRGLQALVISEEWATYREDDVGGAQFVKELVLNDIWWDKIDYIIGFTNPIYDMLRFADTDKPALHLIYDM